MSIGIIIMRRAVFLALALIIAVFLTGFIIGATGYVDNVVKAIINEEVRAYRQALSKMPNVNQSYVDKLTRSYQQMLVRTYGLDKPWIYRIIPLVYSTLIFKFGDVQQTSVAEVAGFQLPAKASDVILACLPRTIVMITVAELITIVLALLIAPRITFKIGSLADRIAVIYAALTNAIPVWWLALVMIFIFSYRLGVAPQQFRGVIKVLSTMSSAFMAGNAVSFFSSFGNLLSYVWLPILTIVITLLGPWIYSTRAMLLRMVREDFVLAAVARGLPQKVVLRKYILRPALSPIMTSVLLGLAGTLGGYIITESVFDWPGMGTLYYQAIASGDPATILGLTYILTLVYVVARFILEVLYVALDPRVRL
uniref:ABC transporter permease n=1 Tax=Ignisphaera aggregans TaxID=334771 RepID=A0A7J2U6C0_9CREN